MVRDPTSIKLKQMESRLLNLPEEVLDSIIANVTADEDLAEVVLVCRRLNALADPYRYNYINVVRSRQAQWLVHSLQNRPSRAKFLKSLLVSTAFGDDAGLQKLPPQLFMLNNLEALSLETPDCNQKPSAEREPWISLQERYERLFEQSSMVVPQDQRALSRLKSCESRTQMLWNVSLKQCRYHTLRGRPKRDLSAKQIRNAVPPPETPRTHHLLRIYRLSPEFPAYLSRRRSS